MAQLLVGAISDQLGLASGWETVHARHAGRNFDVKRTFWACPSDKFRTVQPADLPLEAGHYGPRLGTIEHLELPRDKRLWIVAQVDDGYDLRREEWALSYQLVERRDGLFDLEAVAVVPKSATICLPPITVKDGTLYDAARRATYSGTTATASRSKRPSRRSTAVSASWSSTPTRRRRHAEADRC
jgi:hypothetical protein